MYSFYRVTPPPRCDFFHYIYKSLNGHAQYYNKMFLKIYMQGLTRHRFRFILLPAVIAVSISTLILYKLIEAPASLARLSRLEQIIHDDEASNLENERLGFVTYLSSRSNDSSRDPYFEMTRVMAYKLLHHNHTRTRLPNAPLVVLVTETVSEKKKQRLRDDGAIVQDVTAITTDAELNEESARYVDTMTKLRIWQLLDFDRMLFMDSDVYIVRSLDGVFKDPASYPIPRNREIDEAPDEHPSEDMYLLAATDDMVWENPHTIPIVPNLSFNSGFFLFRPSLKMFMRYLSIIPKKGRYHEGTVDQSLLNYAHNKSSSTPWARLEPGRWVAGMPIYADYEYGSATLHEKMWKISDDRLAEMYSADYLACLEHLGND